ncbi:Folliculin-interacting protein 2 [Armadillidium nasatum]|uniref:Folliculin-interacting protein 2 n=1 Tax=Armadillidium nasatum TaxID=96803 RepID=A0A5N5TE69_9CRUS|nr:Folliculin-interacting protein 2 [Armadillidium nasatum]
MIRKKVRGFSNTPINCTTKSLPYNALWSQLRELTGSIGFPSKVTKTVLIGDSVHKDLLSHALVVLSYLIRCSQVLENHFEENEGGDILSGSSKSISELSSSSSTSVMTLLESNVTTTSAGATSEVSRRSSFKINRNYRQDSRTKLKRADSAKKRNSSFSTKSTEEDKHPINDDFCHKFPHSSETSKYTPFQECSSSKSNQRSGLTSSKTMGNLSLVYDLSCDTLDDSDSRILPEHSRHDSVAPEVNLKDPFPTFISSKFSGGMSEVSSCKDKLEVKVSGEEINLEIEEGGRVLFILGEDDKLEGLKPKTSRDVSPVCNTSLNESVKCIKDEVKITEDSYPKILQSESHVEVKTLPSSEDLSKIEYFGNHGNSPLNNYSQKISLDTNKPLIPESTHKRNMSDPTNGSYLSDISSYNFNSQNNKALEVVNEKDIGISYSEDSRVKKKRKRKPNEELDNENFTSESSLEEWDRLDMHSKIIDVHRINLNSQKQSRLNVAESYMGGVLDHYSSVFFLHASTDVDSHLEEKIRLDLSAAAQRPVLDTKVSEAIAIIADTEKWYVYSSSPNFSISSSSTHT